MSDGSLRYQIAFDVQGMGETVRATRSIQDLQKASNAARSQRILDLGLAAQARNAGAATVEVKNLGNAMSNLARLAGLGSIAESVQQVSSLRAAAKGAGGALGFMVAAAGPLAATVAVAELINAGLRKYGEYLDAATDKTINLAKATDAAFKAGRVGMAPDATEEERQASIKAVNERMGQLSETRSKTKDPRQIEEIDAQMRVLDLQNKRLSENPLLTKAEKERAEKAKAEDAKKRELAPAFAADQAAARRRERFELSLADTPDTLGGAQQRRQILLEQSNALTGERGQAAAALNVATRTGTADDLAEAQRALAGVMEQEADIRQRLVAENKTIDQLTAKDAEARQKAQLDLRKEAQQALKGESADVARRLGGAPAVDSYARSGLFVGSGNPGAESLRWQQASAKVLERILTVLKNQAAANPAGAVAAWGGS